MLESGHYFAPSSGMNRANKMNVSVLKAVFGLLCILLLASNLRSISHWNEARGVYDDICYLRQAHLFQRFGLGGIDTDISRDDDGYLSSKLKEIGFPTWSNAATAPCHNAMPAVKKFVIQYPPGTGLVMALFPQGYQAIPLFMLSTIAVFGFAVLAIVSARTTLSVLSAGVFGCLAIYLMINPSKASYSMAPTMVLCALAGYLTPRWVAEMQRHRRLWLTLILGFVLGLAVDFRLPNLFLASGYFLSLLISMLSTRKLSSLLQGALFAISFLVGMSPTLVSNTVNAGSPLSTTYGSSDVTPPDFSFSIVWQYVADMQFVLLALAIAGATILARARDHTTRRVALLTAANLAVNLAFFLSHPVFTPYYTVPIAMLSLWSLLFAWLEQKTEAVDEHLVARAANAAS
jgi:hypothetical protein